MARIEPFRAYRPRVDLAAQVTSLPYDVMSSDEARQMALGNAQSFLHVIKPEIDLPAGTGPYDEVVYAKGAENLRRLLDAGTLVQEPAPALYLYRQQMGSHIQTGLVAGVSVDEYESGAIKKHEFTRPVKEDDRTRHMDALDANPGPVSLTYRSRADIDALMGRLTAGSPTYDFHAPGGIQHALWIVSSPVDQEALIAAFAQVPSLYVADGHHRSAAAARIRAARKDANPTHSGREGYNFFLGVIFPHDQMLIMDYNRVVRDLNGLSPAQLVAAASECFDVEATGSPAPTRSRTFGMYVGGQWYRLAAKDGTYPPTDPVNRLDVAILQHNLLGPILGVGDPRVDERVDFVGGIRGLDELVHRVNSGAHAVAFAMYPTAIEDLFAVSDAGEVMPPKSTWFEPKLADGLLSLPLD